jgi:SAM-dependent methyltransferase
VRFRSIVHLLSTELFGSSLALPDFPANKELAGLGMSDWSGYAAPLGERLAYTNTYLHQEPFLDIADPDPAFFGRMDFVICTEVLEHVPPPVQPAFDNLHRLLKPGGFAIVTVPYMLQEQTIEHFPELHDYRIEGEGQTAVLWNLTQDGREQVFRDLVFHGGDGSTLEMRLFSEAGLIGSLKRAGFRSVSVRAEPCPQFGILHPESWSLPVVARK